jgi:hypothetical protein
MGAKLVFRESGCFTTDQGRVSSRSDPLLFALLAFCFRWLAKPYSSLLVEWRNTQKDHD